LVSRLGSGAFETIGGEVVNVALLALTRGMPKDTQAMLVCDVSTGKSPDDKAALLRGNPPTALLKLTQTGQLENPDARVMTELIAAQPLLKNVANSWQGIKTSDDPRFTHLFWEHQSVEEKWKFYQRAPRSPGFYCGREEILLWEDGLGQLTEVCQKGAPFRGKSGWGRAGIAIHGMSGLTATIYTGDKFSSDVSILDPHDQLDLAALWCFCSSPGFALAVRALDQKLGVTNSTMAKVPFNLSHWQRVAAEKYPHGLPNPFSNDPTQWLFNGHPAAADQPLHVAVARLVGYEWPRQTDSSFPDCPALGPDGLEALTDEDGIVCLAPVRGEASAIERLRKLLATALGDEWSSAKERELLLATAVDNNAKKSEPDLENWLRSSFFSEHCKLFQSRPFIWQIWDGHPYGFSALVNYHKLAAPNGQGRRTLEQLTFTYLGDWIDRQKLDQAEGINGADDRLAAALDLKGQLKKILEGEPPFDVFVRWKPLHQQAIGWDPDINDGVRLNIRPFLSAQLRKGGKTGAGILRAKPGTIKWAKDRGKEPMRSKQEFPWFWGWDENNHAVATDFGATIPSAPPVGESFDGNRWNDLHYSRAAKEAARAGHRGEG
jgi:hypothetical protein